MCSVRLQNLIFIILFFGINCQIHLFAQQINQKDSEGKKHGYWSKNYPKTSVKRYEGKFVHGQEVDTFKYYKNYRGKALLTALKIFNPDKEIHLVFLNSAGKKISEGNVSDSIRIDKWVYYHRRSPMIMTEELYNNQGLLEGEKKVYYKNGKLAQKAHYKNNKLEGISIWYQKNGLIIKKLNYENGLLHGPATFYDSKERISKEGQYDMDRKTGEWKLYKNGVLEKIINHSK